MYYNIITAKNFNDIEILSKAKINEIDNGYKLDPWFNYGTVYFAVIGSDALQMFREKYGVKLTRYAETIKTDGKTRAKVLPYILPEFYYDARTGKSGLTNFCEYTEINYLVEFDGALFRFNNWSGNKTRTLSLFNDNTEYNKYLPYNWESENQAPAKVGVLSDKKLKAWYEYLMSKKQAAENEKNKRENKVNLFLDKIKSIDTSKFDDSFVSEKSGHFVCNGLRYSYTIENGFISENIQVHYSCKKNLDSFLNMI